MTGLLANIQNENDAYRALEQVHQLFAQAQKRRAVDDVMALLHGRDTKYLRSEFKPALEALVGAVYTDGGFSAGLAWPIDFAKQ